ncbi:DinB family protein [Hymenobacter jeollabukensis]|uniref:DinB family protein n=1 Tax=Hymenobacter jeollabukensis TaxID=2025313 RepID=A0A5R8WWF8_9BACT|nr:DinB family protein [Hymenobacter jeollabukensis]TLM96806.1 DinB family protein [Hymenobacter jeollabukensis]
MNNRLHLRFEQLESATEQLLQAAANLGERAYAAPAAGQWSAAHVVHHLLASEVAIGQYLQQKLREQAQLGPATLGTKLRAVLLRLALRLPGLKFKAPAKLAALTPTDTTALPPLADMRQQWASTRRQLEQLLNEFPSKLARRPIFKHPRAGMLTIEQTLDFMLDHVLHHRQQVARIAKALGAAPVPAPPARKGQQAAAG